MIKTNAQLGVEIGIECVAPEQISLTFRQAPVHGIAFELDHQAVIGGAIPALQVKGRDVIIGVVFEAIAQQRPESMLIGQFQLPWTRQRIGAFRQRVAIGICVRIAGILGGVSALHLHVALRHGGVTRGASIRAVIRGLMGRRIGIICVHCMWILLLRQDGSRKQQPCNNACMQTISGEILHTHDTTTSRNIPASIWNNR